MQKSTAGIQQELFLLLRQFLLEMKSNIDPNRIQLSFHLDKDLSIDSLTKAELFHRIEKKFNIIIDQKSLITAETLNDIVKIIERAIPEKVRATFQYIEPLKTEVHVDPTHIQTLTELLLVYAEKEPDRPHIYLQDEYGAESIITYGELYRKASQVAAGLVARGLQEKETVAIMLPTSHAFFYSFFGVLLAGGIPVPIYPPFRPDRIAEYALREATILRNAEVRFLITFHEAESLSRLLRIQINSLKSVVTTESLMSSTAISPIILKNPDEAAMIQYTSGSTNIPKGVLLSHANLLTNIRAAGKAMQVKPTDVVVSWLPLYHDMGLIGSWLGSFYHGIPVTIMSPLAFLTRPERWLWAIHYHRATLSASPNFGYELCVRKILDEDIKDLNLSTWRFALNGAEAVKYRTIRRFIDKFKPHGFGEETLNPVYGLAENTVALTIPALGNTPRVDRIQREACEIEHKAIPVAAEAQNYVEFLSSGKPIENHDIRVVDATNQPLAERCIGALQFRGPSAMQGYYRNPELTAAIYHDGWWDTGDLAYIVDGELFITGRKKDLIIKAGRNIYPEEVELAAAEVRDIRKGCVAAFGFYDSDTGTEKLVVVAETTVTDKKRKSEMELEIIDQINLLLGSPPDRVLLVKPHSIPKTSSGKLMRSACKDIFMKGQLKKRRTPVWLQFLNLLSKAVIKKITQVISFSLRFLYTSYLALLMLVFFVPVGLSILISSPNTAQKTAKLWMKLFFILGGCPLSIKGKEYLTSNQQFIYAANHASYIDAAVLIAILPAPITMVGKQELARVPVLGWFMKKLGHLFVERFDFAQSMADTDRIKNIIKQGHSLAIFPEGTFVYSAGLRPFKMGAFKVAVETATAVCPVALKGTRQILRAGRFLLRPGKIEVTICPALTPPPESSSWNELMIYREQVRNDIAKFCGEDIVNV